MTPNDSRFDDSTHLSRRRLIAGSSLSAVAALAGCLNTGGSDGSDDDESTPAPPETTESEDVPQTPTVENPPEAVYKPTHREAMVHLDPVEAGPYTLGPMLTYPHTFWLVTGRQGEEVRPDSEGIHLMFSVWDTETGTVLPVDVGAEIRLLRDGDVVDTRSPWPMISQSMGFHFGDNVPLPEHGRYTVEVDLNPIGVRRTGAFEGRFESRESASFEVEFDREFQRQVVSEVEFLDEDEWGAEGALEPMGGGESDHDSERAQDAHDGDSDMHAGEDGQDDHGSHEMGFSALPPADSYPGRALGEPTSGDARFVVRYLSATHLSEEGYLLVSPRTPYNRVPLADMALSVSGAVEGKLTQTLDSDLGHHYGLEASLSAGDSVEILVESPPQVARHQGYETAFLEMPSTTVEVPE